MKLTEPEHQRPADADARQAIEPVVCYPTDTLPPPDLVKLRQARETATLSDSVLVPPRDARCIDVPAGHILRISCAETPQVGDLNLWAAENVSERFYAGKTRALHGTHVSTGDRLWSCFPHMRPMATLIDDSLDWYGFDAYGGSVHDVIGTRCDPYTGRLLSGDDYHYCCHSNLTRAFAEHQDLTLLAAEAYVHDVLNVFMCTGFMPDTKQYFMKQSPVRKGDYIELFAEIDLIAGLSACPGGDCGQEHTSDVAQCGPLLMEIFTPEHNDHQPPQNSAYDRSHGAKT